MIELVYFRIADTYNIIDKPNHRSSHAFVTIWGGGIIFPIVFMVPLIISVFEGWIIISLSLIVISLISFVDDMVSLNSRIRIVIQGFSVIILLLQITGYANILLFIMVTGIINAYNNINFVIVIIKIHSAN